MISRLPGHEVPARAPLDRVSWDLIPLDEGLGGAGYVSHFKCTFTGFNHVYIQQDKSLTLSVVEKYLTLLANHHRVTPKFIRLDGETSLGAKFAALYNGKGMIIKRSAAATQAQNGHGERAGRSILTMARSMAIHAKLSSNLWPELAQTTGYILDRLPTKWLGNRTPFEALTGARPDINYMHPVGCKAFYHQKDLLKLAKLAPRAQIGYLLGYQSTNQWHVWEPRSGKVIISRDVTFD